MELAAAFTREREARTAFLLLPVLFGLGIVGYFLAEHEPSLFAGPVVGGVFLALALAVRARVRADPWAHRGGRLEAFHLVFMGIFTVFAGFSAASLRTRAVAEPVLASERIAEISGYIESIEPGPNRQRITLRVRTLEGTPAAQTPYRVRIGVPAKATLYAGQAVVLRARLAPPADPSMPGGYDFRREAFFRAIGAVGYAIGPVRLEGAPLPPLGLRINAAIDNARNLFTERIARSIGGQSGALSAALVTGKRGLISEAVNDDLRLAGLYHVVSISGLHMVLAAGVMFWLVRAVLSAFPGGALRWPIRKLAALVAMLGASAYCIFSGSEVATERSLIMTLVMLGAVVVDRPALAMRNLAISALIVLAREPEALLGPSFQMSYAAVAGLITGARLWREWRAQHPKPTRALHHTLALQLVVPILTIAATTLIATLATAPFSAWHFNRLNPYGLIGNSLAIPMVSLVVMPAAVAGTLLFPFGFDAFVWRLMGQGVSGMLWVAERVAKIDQASVAVGQGAALPFVLMIAGVLLAVLPRSRLGLLALVPLGFALLLPWQAQVPDVLIAPSGRMVLARGEQGRHVVLAVGGMDRFALQQWLPALGDRRDGRDETLRQGARCDREGCTLRLANGEWLALSTSVQALREDCRRADIVVTPQMARVDCAARYRFSRADLQRYGAVQLYAPPRGASGWSIRTALDAAKQRPWRPGEGAQASVSAMPAAGQEKTPGVRSGNQGNAKQSGANPHENAVTPLENADKILETGAKAPLLSDPEMDTLALQGSEME